MSQVVAAFDPTSGSGSFGVSFVSGGCGKLHIKNASPFDVQFSINNAPTSAMIVQAGEPRTMLVPFPKAIINWTAIGTLQSSSKQLQSVVYVESYNNSETVPDSLALPRHVNAEKLGYSGTANYSIGVGPVGPAALNIFNPGNSGVNGYFYQAREIIHQAN